MERKNMLGVLSTLIVLALSGCVSTQAFEIPVEDVLEMTTGVWISHYHELTVEHLFRKRIVHPDGSYESYPSIEAEEPDEVGKVEYEETWTAADGRLYFKARVHESSQENPLYALGRLMPGGISFEMLMSEEGYVSGFYPGLPNTSYAKWERYNP